MVETQETNSYKITAQELAETCRELGEGQKVLIINTPNNPSGAVYSDKEIQSLAKVCKESDVIVISDEIYSEVDFSFKRKKGFFYFYPEGTLVTSGLSKAHSAGGYRMGFLAASESLEPLIAALTSLISETFSAVSAPIQYSALTAYEENPRISEYLKNCALIHKACANYMAKRFVRMGASCPSPEGAFYLMPNFQAFSDKLKAREGVETSQDLCNLFLNKLSVAMLPGSDFYLPENKLACRVATVDYDGERVYEAFVLEKVLDEEAFVEKNCPNLKLGLDKLEQFLSKL